MGTNRFVRLTFVLCAVLGAGTAGCTATPSPSEPVRAAPAAEAAAPVVEGTDTIAGSALADIDPAGRGVEDVKANDTADDLADDVPPAPTGFGASLVELRVDSLGDPESLWVSTKHAPVHAQPSAKAEKVGTLIQGDRVEVLERRGEFVRIGDDQWVAAHHLRGKQPDQATFAH